jgi:hypothetical protein
MEAGRAADIRNLHGLKNISWLSSRQINRLADSLSIGAVEKREIIIDDKFSRIRLRPAVRSRAYHLPQPQGRSHTGNYGRA